MFKISDIFILNLGKSYAEKIQCEMRGKFDIFNVETSIKIALDSSQNRVNSKTHYNRNSTFLSYIDVT